MTEYVLDIETHQQRNSFRCDYHTKYFFQIDVNGNVNISTQSCTFTFREGEKKNIISINDNIPVPKYFINIIKALILQESLEMIDNYKRNGLTESQISSTTAVKSDRGIYDEVFETYWKMVIDVIKRVKQEIKELVENPQDNLDIKTQLDTYISKTTQQQENIVELEKKIENIQTAYFDTLNDNKKLKDIINRQNIKQTELECEINRLKGEINTIKQLEETRKREQQKMEEFEKESLWKQYKLQKQNYDPLYR
jgi:hypothetical protein